MARKKKPSLPGVDRMNSLLSASLREHASAEYLSGMLESNRHKELLSVLKSEPQALQQFQQFMAEFAAIVRDTEHQMVAHEFATYLGMRLGDSKAARGQLDPELMKLPPGELVQKLVRDFLIVVNVTKNCFYEHELAEILMAEIESEKPLDPKERKVKQAELEAFALNNFMPVLKQAVQEQKLWQNDLELKSYPKGQKKSPLSPIEELVFGRFVAQA